MNALMERRLRGAIPSQVEAAKALGIRPSAVSRRTCLDESWAIWNRVSKSPLAAMARTAAHRA